MLTVLMATRNRARILSEVLDSYGRLQPPSSGWKLVVVDNGSTDETARVIGSFANRLPLHSVREPKLGKNFALNTALGLVEGDLVVFTDDDAFPASDWLLQLRKAADTQPGYSMFGGTIVPRWEAPPPSWIQWVELGPAYTLTNPALQEGPIEAPFLFGPNMAIRSDVFRSGIRLDPSIGPRGSSYPMGSETELVLRLSRQGHKSWHVHGAVVEHFIREKQLKKSWVMQRVVRYGRGRYRLSVLAGESPKLFMGVPQYLFFDLFKKAVRIVLALMLFRPEALFRSRWRFNYLRGQAIEARILARERSAQTQSAYHEVIH